MNIIAHKEAKKRGKYGRPCDRCAARRIRCVTAQDSAFCTGCLNSGEKCTRDRIRKKSGPKNGRRSRPVVEQPAEMNGPNFLGVGLMKNGEENGHHHLFSEQTQSFTIKKEPSQRTLSLELPQMMNTAPAISPSTQSIPGIPDLRTLEHQQNHSPRLFLEDQAYQEQGMHPHALPRFNVLHPQHSPKYSVQVPRSVPYYHGYIQSPIQPQASPYYPQSPNSQGVTHLSEAVGFRDSEQINNMESPDDHEDILAAFKSNPSPYVAKVSLESLLSRVQVYQTWFYGYWPVLSLGDLIQNISNESDKSGDGYINLNEKNAMAYALCCAVCAAITTQLSFVSPENVVLDSSTVSEAEYASEAKRVRNLFDYTERIEVDTLLSSFFLYAHYTNQKGKIKQAKVYLREAISMAQILGFHEKSQYRDKSCAEVHRWRKIYYTLLVTERYVCFEEGLPVILDPCIDFPELEDEEYPSLLVGFSELIQIFAVPSKDFFFEMNQHRHENYSDERPLDEKRQWILAVQERLGSQRNLPTNVTNPQKLNIILSKAWIRAIACHITWNNGMLRLSENPHDCFGFDFPLVNAREFLAESSYLPDMAFQTNGPGICVKLLEMANSLSFTVQQSSDQLVGLTVLESLFGLVNRFRNDVTLPINVYQGIADLIARHKLKVVPRLIESHEPGYMSQMFPSGTIEELLDDDELPTTDDPVKEDYSPVGLSPYSRQISEASMSMLASVPSFLNMRFPQIDDPPTNQS